MNIAHTEYASTWWVHAYRITQSGDWTESLHRLFIGPLALRRAERWAFPVEVSS